MVKEKRYRIVVIEKPPVWPGAKTYAADRWNEHNAWWKMHAYSLHTYSTLSAAKGNITRALGSGTDRINIAYEIQEIEFVGEWKTVKSDG